MFIDPRLRFMNSHPQKSPPLSDKKPPRDAPKYRAQRTDAATGINHAYDRLHRIHAILAYLKITKQFVPGVSEFLNEAKHTYQQSLARYEAQDFEGAWEFAAACRCLAHVVEVVMSRTLRSDTSYASLVPPPPEQARTGVELTHLEDRLEEVKRVLSRLHWLLENGTLPLEDRTQVRKVTSWGDAFYQLTRRMYGRGSMEDADDLVQAAKAAADSGEHICRNWYVALPRNA